MERGITNKNFSIFADLLFPKYSRSSKAYKAVLVIVEGYSSYTTLYPLHPKNAPEVNEAMKRYITWAERRFSYQHIKKAICDGGGEFVNTEMKAWNRKQGIEFLSNSPHGSHLNLCERAHETLFHMMQSVMATAKLHKSFRKEALEMANFVRNRSYCRTIKDTPYHKMLKKNPDLHKIRKLGSIAYVYQAKVPFGQKSHENCKFGFLVGSLEGQAGYKVLFQRKMSYST